MAALADGVGAVGVAEPGGRVRALPSRTRFSARLGPREGEAKEEVTIGEDSNGGPLKVTACCKSSPEFSS